VVNIKLGKIGQKKLRVGNRYALRRVNVEGQHP